MTDLMEICRGKRVLFVNAIRRDVHSGGGTSTRLLIERLVEVSELRVLSLAPEGGPSRLRALAFAIASLPAPMFVLLYRRKATAWLEFFLRASPWFFLRCLFWRWMAAPEVVLLNHHSVFVFAAAFRGLPVITIWHDVPSLKETHSANPRREARLCAGIERRIARASRLAATFSFHDLRLLRRLHKVATGMLPVVDQRRSERTRPIDPHGLLLVGNWSRAENCDGAHAFFAAYLCACGAAGAAPTKVTFHVAGNQAEAFVERWKNRQPDRASLRIVVTPRFEGMSQFTEMALLAPLATGAGIKLKTIEAWAAGIPVVGTPQAFTGLPPRVWSLGGLRAANIEELAQLCVRPDRLAALCAPLAPHAAFTQYQSAVAESLD